MIQALSLWRGLVDVPAPFRSHSELIAEVARNHRLSVEELLSDNRTDPYVSARREAYYALYINPRRGGFYRSLPEIGRLMGGRDHSTVRFSLAKHPKYVGPMMRPTKPNSEPEPRTLSAAAALDLAKWQALGTPLHDR